MSPPTIEEFIEEVLEDLEREYEHEEFKYAVAPKDKKKIH